MNFRSAVLAAVYAVCAGEGLHGQDISFGAGAGAAVPGGGAGERLDPGPSAMLSAEHRMGRGWGLRLDGEWALLRGAAPSPGQPTAPHSLRSLGVSLNAILWFSDGALDPYAILGLGAYRLQRVGAPVSPYGTTGAVLAGLGIEGHLHRRLSAFGETRAMVHITDYGSDEFSPTVYWPIHVGVRIR